MTNAKAFLVVGLGYGDEGKGSIIDFLCRRQDVKLVVRHGGPQARHNVVLSDGREHGFAQFGSGTLAGVDTYLSKHMFVEPFALLNESEALDRKGISRPLDKMTIDENCVVVTPFHWYSNQILERLRRHARHGSCGMGVWEARNDSVSAITTLHVNSLLDKYDVREVLSVIKNRRLKQFDVWQDLADVSDLYEKLKNESIEDLVEFYYDFSRKVKRYYSFDRYSPLESVQGNIVVEGSQGVLLDPMYGFDPYVTATDSTLKNALKLVDFRAKRAVVKIGVLRTYLTRHGAGPLVTEDTGWTGFSDKHNVTHEWQGDMRFGWFDAVAMRYALKACGGVDYLALTHMDAIENRGFAFCDRYDTPTGTIANLPVPCTTDYLSKYKPILTMGDGSAAIRLIEEMLNTKVGIVSRGPTELDKEYRI